MWNKEAATGMRTVYVIVFTGVETNLMNNISQRKKNVKEKYSNINKIIYVLLINKLFNIIYFLKLKVFH